MSRATFDLGSQLSGKQIAEFREAFNIFDKDRDGSIGPEDFKMMMKTLGLRLTEQEVSLLLKEVDEDGSGEIEFEEMISALVRNMRETTVEEQMAEAFKTFDRENKGYIDSKDFARVMAESGETGVTLTDATAIMRNALDGREKVTRREFMIMLKMCKHSTPT
ncbi:apoptosis-inducing factor [Perkinsus olseni]|uniref:Calmodulin n=2 Tax=Perkinsus olseni TaxID=32597 RepID=A0A7J6NLC0_PEROL|nr:apoptosis-inducing factor [Perkinsus olseni]